MSAQDDLDNKLAANHAADDINTDSSYTIAKTEVAKKKRYIIGFTKRLRFGLAPFAGLSSFTISNATMNVFLSGGGKNGENLEHRIAESQNEAGLVVANSVSGNYDVGAGVVGGVNMLLYEMDSDAGYNRFQLARDRDTGLPIYGRLLQNNDDPLTYTIELYTEDVYDTTGHRFKPYIMPSIVPFRLYVRFMYQFPEELMPPDPDINPNPQVASTFFVDRGDRNVGFDTQEQLTVTATDTLSALSFEYRDQAGCFQLLAKGVVYDVLPGSGVTVSGTTVTWDAVTTGVTLNPGDRVIAYYKSKQPVSM